VGVVGPTGSGKSVLARELALSFGGEVVGCDALQVYRGLDVGTGKMTVAERSGVPHHLIDVRDPDVEFSAADYMREASFAIEGVWSRRKPAIVAGGTGLYFRALTAGLLPGPGRDPALRERLQAVAMRRGETFLHRMLRRFDPRSAERLHPNDRVRVVRALEVSIRARRPMSVLMERRESPLSDYRLVRLGLAPSRAELHARIDARVARMFALGLVEETRALVRAFGSTAPAFKAIGYREVLRHLAGELSLEDAERLTARATRRYAKRQMTWFRAEEDVYWLSGVGEDRGVLEQATAHLDEVLAPCSSRHQERLHAKATR